MTYEQPNRLTSTNAVTGDLIKSKTDNQSTYADNWELIWGKKKDATLVVEDTIEVAENVYDGQNCD